ncbi:hypothetical protein AGOR_G00210410 [Albula goreensis]|uniref:Ig-like domain-containing protein n=1 Tax=Albula goreensis TaxID=1534307 RepID=A0A8T3CQM9_9TELE|nr:hypothetical protein AGOR_G00210410 [Albula goreensis]
MACLSLDLCVGVLLLIGLRCQSCAGSKVYSSPGASVALPCGTRVHGPCSKISWKYKEKFFFFRDLVESGKVIDMKMGRLRMGADCSLHISDVSFMDGGQYMCNDGATSANTTLQLLNITVTPNTGLNAGAQASLSCFLSEASGSAVCNHTGIYLSWMGETGNELQGNRYSISHPTLCFSKLEVKLKRTDHNRQWKCQLTEGKEVKTAYSYITKLKDGADEVFAVVGESVTLLCSDSTSPGVGESLRWSWQKKELITANQGGDVTVSDNGKKTEFKINPDSSLAIKAVTAAHSGYYECSLFNDSGLISIRRRILLHTLHETTDLPSAPPEDVNFTLTCSLTCAAACDEDINLTWSHSSGEQQQGGAVVKINNTLISQLLVPKSQASRTSTCVVLREGAEIANLKSPVQGVDYTVPVIIICMTALLLFVIAAGIFLWRSRETFTGSPCTNVRMVNNAPLYEECGEPAYSRATERQGSREQLQTISTIYVM